MKHTHTETDLPIENEFPKLIRDKLPGIIKADSKTIVTHIADDKLIEEATELQEAKTPEHQKEELADVREVIIALQEALGVSEGEIVEIQKSKAKERGGFGGRIILDEKPKSRLL